MPAAADPVTDAEFGGRMRRLGPFEEAPHIAAAVSGGADSLCLATLLHKWTSSLGGRTSGLVVDHGLRPESRDEALGVTQQLRAMGIEAHLLVWTGEKPSRNLQAHARDARYALILDWCRAHGVIHLAVGHHACDQAETYLLRQRAGSGPDGLAGMAAVSERDGVRLIRPLLDLPPRRLRATLAAKSQTWVEDPSNSDLKYARTAIRREIRSDKEIRRLCAERDAHAIRRRAADYTDAQFLAVSVRLHAPGYATLDLDAFRTLPPEEARRCLARVLLCVGTHSYVPRTARLETLRQHLGSDRAGKSRTLAGCVIILKAPNIVAVCREPAAADQVTGVSSAQDLVWDQRFKLRIAWRDGTPKPLTVRRLNDRAWGTLRQRFPDAARALAAQGGPLGLPAPARSSLPMLCDLDGPCALPHLPNQSVRPTDGPCTLQVSFQPRLPLAGASFAVGGS